MFDYRIILCPTDFSEHSDAALARAEDLARRLDADLVLLHVVEPLLVPVEYEFSTDATVAYSPPELTMFASARPVNRLRVHGALAWQRDPERLRRG